MWIAIIASTLLSFSSCESDDDEPRNAGSTEVGVTINRTELKLTPNCVYSHSFDYYGYAMTYFSATLSSKEDGYIIFGFKCSSDFSENEEINVSLLEYRSWTEISFSDYEEIGGRIIVKDISANKITLEFDNFKFLKDDDEFVVNGTIEYIEDGTVLE